ncbi:RagB/SusD family nutrient uptake outer membrane protein [Sphingobacterium lumbrici]|uniref:RagB/SusD family nutrient uptake outer membrane protein n=1 Tax=Sphingobacterium lumbrici TaxID=2559600 RepID=UPI0011286649|nr:RagB/SusD family nutrient uptake outer membrane protein [Sphingobacterium lumbrici]
MKNRLLSFTLLLFILLFASSCEKWLDVQPRTKVKSDVLLETEQGYKDALLGAYTLLTPESLYGRELSFGFFDALAKFYEQTSTQYRDLAAGNNQNLYTFPTVKPRIDQFWNGLYNVQANVNNILDHIDADKNKFTGSNYAIIKGEALALRAFIHLELFKIFASNDELSLEQPAIPYVKSLSTKITPSSTGLEVLNYITEDLTDAATYLQSDPITKGQKKSADEFLNDRNLRLNYYAVKGLLARAYLWQNDYSKALAAAREVMLAGNQIFPWIKSENLINSDNKQQDLTFSTEHLFALNVFNLQTIANNWFTGATSDRQLTKRGRIASGASVTYYYEGLFENTHTVTTGATDYRFLIIADPNIVASDASSNYYVLKKYYQPAGYNPDFAARIPLIRRSEMNYIAAECILNLNEAADFPTAIGYLNEVRQHRGITTDLVSNLPAASIRIEITKEYWKEFQGEGQFFFYAKRNRSVPVNFPTTATFAGEWANYGSLPAALWVLPKPDNEIEYNN